jgi:hypothetical protein
MDKQITILGFAGSLRKGSYNKALMRAALELSPENAKLEIFEEFRPIIWTWKTECRKKSKNLKKKSGYRMRY